MLRSLIVLAVFATGGVCLAPGGLIADPAGAREEPLVDQVNRAVKRGVNFLLDLQQLNGSWEVDQAIASSRPGGETSLVLLALLNAGLKPDDPHIARGLDWLRDVPPENTYVVGLQTMVFAAAGDPRDKVRIQRNVDWLIDARVMRGDTFLGWTYRTAHGQRFGGISDNSNTQYALLGLHEGHVAGAKIPRSVWVSIRDYYISTQHREFGRRGSWGYMPRMNEARLTMTTAGLCGLIISGLELNESREKMSADGLAAANCGRYTENQPIQWALEWIGNNLQLEQNQATYYNLYGIERAGRLSGLRFLGPHDWYREGCTYLVRQQSEDGSWSNHRGQLDGSPAVATSFSLLFLSKGRTPVLISKMVHGPGDDWNNDRNDASHLVAFVSRDLFKRQPLAWQAFDAKRSLSDNAAENKKTLAELLQSPIVYFNGHRPPQFSDEEEKLLKEYVEQGGFILAEACCSKDGGDEFGGGFRSLISRLFDADALQPIPPEHPIWRSFHLITPPRGFQLYGVQQGCKTVVVYSPQDLSCYWEENDTASDRGKFAFELGANIAAYATGMELPKWRGTEVEVLGGPDQRRIPRGFLKVAQLRHAGDWEPAPAAMRNLMSHLRDRLRLEVVPQKEALSPSSPAVLDYRFLYLHGRNAFSFRTDARALKNLRADLQTGGLLLADACCGSKAFDRSFREFVQQLFPDKKLERIPLNDELFGKELNGRAITSVRCRREGTDGRPEARMRDVPPYLEGVKVNGRWVVIYSKYDLGCALERHQAPDCLGHDYDSALRLGTAAVLYALKR